MEKIIDRLIKIKSLPLKSQGISMLPLFWPDDTVYFKKIAFSKIKVNDIIVINNNKQFIAHRVIYKTSKHLITKGDNNPQSDGKIYPGQIIGKVYQIKRNGNIFNPEQLYLIQSTLYFQEIVKIKNIFEHEKINYVFLKGLPLHLYFEKSHPQRIYADCDVLIDKKDFQKAEKIIERFGYKKTDQKNKQVENNYFKVINGFSVVFDIHLEPAFLMTQFSGLEALYPQKLINQLTEELLKNKKKVKINDEFFFILNTKYLILYLALHFFHHNFRGAFRLDFLDKVIRKVCHAEFSSASRSKILKQVQDDIIKYRLKNFVYPVFMLLQKYYNTPLSRSFTATMKQSNNKTMKCYLKINIFDDEPRIKAGISRFKNLFLLSPHPWWKKIFVFTNPSVIYSIFWSLQKKLFSFFSVRRVNPSDLS